MRQAQQTASDPDGWPTTAVKISRYNVLDGHARSQAGKDQPIVRTMVEKDPGTVTMGYEIIRHHPATAHLCVPCGPCGEGLITACKKWQGHHTDGDRDCHPANRSIR